MEFVQFHPTGLAGLGILVTEGARGEVVFSVTLTVSASWSATHPPLRTSHPAISWQRAMANEVREGRGCGPHKDSVLLDLTHLEPSHIDEKLPDITEFARTYLAVEPHHQPIPVFPTAHYAMGGIPPPTRPRSTTTAKRPSPASTQLVRLLVCPSTVQTVWAPTPCWTSTCSVSVQAARLQSTQHPLSSCRFRTTLQIAFSTCSTASSKAGHREGRRYPRRPAEGYGS